MSLSRLWKGVRKVVAPIVGSVIGGPIGGVIGTALGGSTKVPNAISPIPAASAPASPAAVNWGAFSEPAVMPGGSMIRPVGWPLVGQAMGPGLTAKTLLPLAGGAVGGAVMRGAVGARRLAAGAAALCRKHPQWCTTIGGLAAVEALMRSGQLPVPKRRRGRGITATELRNFKRVARFTSKYCAPVRRAMSAPAVRKGR